jgi:hypothetical protein
VTSGQVWGEGMALHRIIGFALTGSTGGRPSRAPVASIGLAAAFALGLAAASGSAARAGDYDDPSGTTFTSKVLKAIGLPDPDHPEYEINYSERSPLVVPPNRNLPAPIATDRPPAPNWPQDPDFKKRQAAAKSDKPIRPADPVIEDGRPLRPDELIPKGSRTSAPSSSPGIEPKGEKGVLTFDWFKKEQYGTFTGEPPRASLTDPPPGYQTPSPDQPYGIPPDSKPYKPPTLGERMEPQR